MADCTVCEKYISGNVQDPIIHVRTGYYHYGCFRKRFVEHQFEFAGEDVEEVPEVVSPPIDDLVPVEVLMVPTPMEARDPWDVDVG